MAQNVVYWKFENGTLDIRGDEAEGYTVWNISDTYTKTDVPWRSVAEQITEVIIQNNINITNMSYWFYRCVNFNQSITIPNSVTKMNGCFQNCTSFNQPITIPNSVTDMSSCFYNCIGFNQPIIISNSVINMSSCFAGCNSFNQSIVIPNSVTDMNNCFLNCNSFNQSIIIPDSVTNMDYCFQGCNSFDNYIYFLGRINNYTNIFRNIESAELIPLAYSVNNISISNQNYSTLQTIANSYTNVYISSFICTDGEYIYTRNNIKVLDKTKTSYSAVPQTYVHPWNTSLVNSIDDLSECFRDCINLTSAPSIPTSVINMGRCFYNCISLTTPPNLDNCSNITSMIYCFYNCYSLTQMPNIPNNVWDLQMTFQNCTSLVTVSSIPSSVTTMQYCFRGCTSLTTPPDMSNATSVTKMQGCFEHCVSLISTPSIPNSVDNIAGCFMNCINLTGVIEINSVILTSTDVFKDTTKLIVLKGAYPQLSTIADQYSNVYVYSLSDTITGERNDDILNLATLSVQVNRFKAGSNDDVLSAINVYKNNNSSTPLNLEWFTDDVADPQPNSTTWNQGEGWYLRDGNAPNYIFVEQNNEQLDTTKAYYKALESFIMDESPKIFYTNIDSISEDETTTFNIIVTDAYGEAATQYLTVPIAFYTMDVVKGGRVISFGQHATQDMLYKLLEEAPTDWLTDYNNYYQKDTFGNYIQLNEITAPSFETDTYYQLEYPDGLFNCRMGTKFIDMTAKEIESFIESLNI